VGAVHWGELGRDRQAARLGSLDDPAIVIGLLKKHPGSFSDAWNRRWLTQKEFGLP